MTRTQEAILFGIVGIVASGLIASRILLINQNTVPTPSTGHPQNPMTVQRPLQVGSQVVSVETRKTEAELELGLSWREQMGEDEGMVFVYPTVQPVTYWMKGMTFPLDFVWVANGKVVDITEQVPAPTSDNPVIKTVRPKVAVDMVLEVNAGWVKQHGIRIGMSVKWLEPQNKD